MERDSERLWEGNLRFFGEAGASISHEIKNVLAIIGESAGLLEDLLLMHERGADLAPERLKMISERIRKQTGRADDLVRRLNTFSHSSDDPIKTVDLPELVDLLVTLAQRPAAMKETELELRPAASFLSIRTDPFSLEHLLWRCVAYAVASVNEQRRVQVAVQEAGEGAWIEISGMEPGTNADVAQGFPGSRERRLISHLGGKLDVDFEKGVLWLQLPLQMPEGE